MLHNLRGEPASKVTGLFLKVGPRLLELASETRMVTHATYDPSIWSSLCANFYEFDVKSAFLSCFSGEDPAVPGGPGADDQRVEGRAVLQGGRRVPRRHLLLTQVSLSDKRAFAPTDLRKF